MVQGSLAKGKRKAEDTQAQDIRGGRAAAFGATHRTPSAAAWAAGFVDEVRSAVTYDLPSPARAAPGIHAAPDHAENPEHTPVKDTGQRLAGNAYDSTEERGACGKPLHFAAYGRIVEVSCGPPLARSFSLRHVNGSPRFYSEGLGVRLSNVSSKDGCSSPGGGRVLAGECVLEHASGLHRPFLLAQWGDTVQLSALDMDTQVEQPVLTFRLLDGHCSPLPCHRCILGAGPSICIHVSGSSVLVAFLSEAIAADGRPSRWQVHLLRLSGSSVVRPLLCGAETHGQAVLPGHMTVAVACERREGTGVAHSAMVLRCSGDQLGQWRWAAEQLEQVHAVTAACIIPALPRAASAALAAGCRVPAGCIAIAMHTGTLSLFRNTPGEDLGSCLVRCLRQLSMQPDSEACTPPLSAVSALDEAEGQERLADALLASSAARWRRERAAQEALLQKQRSGGFTDVSGGGREPIQAAGGPEARVQLPHAPVQLAFAPGGAGEGLLLALSRAAEGELCCLTWPRLEQLWPLLEGVDGVLALDSCGLDDARHPRQGEQEDIGPGLHGPGSCSALAVLHADAAMDWSSAAIPGLACPAVLLPAAAAGSSRAADVTEAPYALRSVLSALQSRLDEGCSVLQRTDALHARKRSLIASSLCLLSTHCSRTYHISKHGRQQPAQGVADSAAAGSTTSCDPVSFVPVRVGSPTPQDDSRQGNLVVTCSSLSFQWQTNGRGVLTAELAHSGGGLGFDLSGTQLLVTSAQLPLLVKPFPHADARKALPDSAGGQAHAALVLRAAVSVDSLPVASSGPVCLNVFAVLPQLEQPPHAAAVARGCAEPSTSKPYGASSLGMFISVPVGHRVQRLGSVQLTWQDMLSRVSSTADEQPKEATTQMHLVMEAAGAHTVGKSPQVLQDSLGLQLDWQTGKGAGLSSACGSTVHVAFHGSRHAEVVVRSAGANACAIMGSCVRSTLEAAPADAGHTAMPEALANVRSGMGTGDIDDLAAAIAALSTEVESTLQCLRRKEHANDQTGRTEDDIADVALGSQGAVSALTDAAVMRAMQQSMKTISRDGVT